ncbi:MAG: hypothetical protein Q8P64_08835, partial [Deltaproteobacteria bacterium]|nr:hypothetical protein [Deltaproteobacteria bacterium]
GVLSERYRRAKAKKEKSQILDEYCHNTGQVRKYVIRKIQPGIDLRPKPRRKRKQTYDGQVIAPLAKVWEIFDCPCGQRLKPILEVELTRLMNLGELRVSDEVALKLKRMSSATIDRKLKHQREVLHLLRSKGGPKLGSLLKRKIPIRLTEWDTSKTGYVEMDLVVHCGSSTFGDYINTLSTTEVSSGWWEGEAIIGKSQQSTFQALKQVRGRAPFDLKGLDSDNGSEFINDILYKYCCREKLEFTRSRPGRKNDNAYIEQKNWTHVRKILGYLRYDTLAELSIINDLYRGDLRLYKNFFQPVMKLVSKERIGGSVKRKYDTPKTPYQRLMDSGQILEQTRKQLETVYLSLNPAQLKRSIDAKLDKLCQAYEKKGRSEQAEPMKKQVPRTVTNYMIERSPVGLPT